VAVHQPQGAELEVLKALWEVGPATVRALNEALQARGHRWAYTTVQTMLQRLGTKGFVRCQKGRPANTYAAAVSREVVLNRRLRDLADQFYDGTASPLLMALVEGGSLTGADVRRLRAMLDELEPPSGPSS
jgi:BlaI family penicillinase repressor